MNGQGPGGIQQTYQRTTALQREIQRGSNQNNAPGAKQLKQFNIPSNLLYFTGGWEAGVILAENSAATPAQSFRYNVVLQLLEVQDASQKNGYQVIEPEAVSGFTIRNSGGKPDYNFITRTYRGTDHVRHTAFFEVLSKGPVQLLLLHEFYIQPAEIVELFNVERKPEEYRRVISLFACGTDKTEVTELPLAKQPVLKLFDKSARAEMDAYIKSNSLSYTELNDIIKLVNYYNAQHPENK